MINSLLAFYFNRLFKGSSHKLISESSLKCNIDDVNQLLSIKKHILEQPRIEKWYH